MADVDLHTFALDREALLVRARAEGASYRSADPFPHAVLDDLLPESVVAAVLDEFDQVPDGSWAHYEDQGNTHKFAVSQEELLGPATRHLIAQLHSGAAIAFLEELTGITGLVADPWLLGGGIHDLPHGGFLNVHADFNRHPHLGLERRLNLLLYLNREWEDDWGGQLELWAPGATAAAKVVRPDFGRLVVFNTTDRSLHGNPSPVACPPGRSRRSLALYYYSASRPEHERSRPHSTLYGADAHAGTSGSAPEAGSSRLASRLLPPVVTDAVRRVRRSAADRAPIPTASPDPMALDHWSRIALLSERVMSGGEGRRWNYTWCTFHAADVARALGIERITVVELGCAGGNGLVALEHAAEAAEAALGVAVDVHGFDNVVGLPPPVDHRDAPYVMQAGEFPMDLDRLRARLRRTELHMGLVSETVSEFVASSPAPIGFAAFDLDLYTSTRDALALFAGEDPATLLPRVLCYFDDVVGYPWGDANGPRPAVREFNAAHEGRRLVDTLYGMGHVVPHHQRGARWVDCLFLAHVLDHPRYADDEHTRFSSRLDLS